MRKTLLRAKDEIVDFLFQAIEDGNKRNKSVDGYYLSGCTQDGLRKCLQMNSVEICHFVKIHMANTNFGNKVVEIERRAGNNGMNIYKVVELHGPNN